MLQKFPVSVNFAGGLDTKTDKWQVPLGKFLELENTIFTKQGMLQKRNGFGNLPAITATNVSTDLSTYLGNLIALSDSLQVLNQDSAQWLNRGAIQPVSLDTIPLVRTSGSQIILDTAVAPNGLACSAFTEGGLAYYQVSDSISGQIIVNKTPLPATSSLGRTFVLGNFFIVTFLVSTPFRLQYIAIPLNNPSAPVGPTTLSSQVKSLTAGYDGYVANNSLYLAWNASDIGGAIRITAVDIHLNQSNVVFFATQTADLMSVTADVSANSPVIWVTYWDSTSMNLKTLAVNQVLSTVLAPTLLVTGLTLQTITSVADNQLLTAIYDNVNTYSYSAVRTDFVSKVTCTQTGTVGSPSIILRSVGLASKAVIFNNIIYILVEYAGTFQPTYFLIDTTGSITAKLAYSNGEPLYAVSQVLPGITVNDNTLSIGYLIRDLLATVNKSQGNTNPNGIYTQTGVNLAAFTIPGTGSIPAEIASALHLTGGYVWEYDGAKPVEHGFAVWPEDLLVTTSPTGGLITDQQYFYAVTYEWTDAKGLLHRSAPSVPFGIVTAGGNTSSNTLQIPTLRLTAKGAANPVRIVIYRWSTSQQIYYQITSIANPLLNNPAVDSVIYVDTQADSVILGNVILYTTGDVVEDIAAPACSTSTLFKARMWVVDAEDKNLLWYSKQVIEATPVEFSDLFTVYVAPSTAAQGNTGPITALSVLDDKLIMFKKNSIYYLTGNGPDNTGANNDFSEPTFLLSTVGSTNQKSIVFMPQGLMFQSDKGIWLLDRNLSTSYIGAPVEEFNSSVVVSAINIPGTNEVRFTLDTGETLVYDYYFGQWSVFTGIPGVSSTLYQDLHTFLNKFGEVLQETPGKYLDGGSPVLIKFTTSWIKLTGLQGFQRLYYMYILGQYKSPHKLSVQWAYDYNDNSISQTVPVVPDNYSQPYGDYSLYGGGPETYGGPGNTEWWRVFVTTGKCTSFRMTLIESYDATVGPPTGEGLTISGMNFVIGAKKGYPTLKPSRSAG